MLKNQSYLATAGLLLLVLAYPSLKFDRHKAVTDHIDFMYQEEQVHF
jgi:hypothetical protein